VPLPHRCRAASATKPGCARNDPSANAAQDVLALDDAIKLHRSPNQLKPFDETDRFIIVREAIGKWAARCNLNRNPEMPAGFRGRTADGIAPRTIGAA
jgi:hypothetical protein